MSVQTIVLFGGVVLFFSKRNLGYFIPSPVVMGVVFVGHYTDCSPPPASPARTPSLFIYTVALYLLYLYICFFCAFHIFPLRASSSHIHRI